ncbi:lia operon protein LiaI [Caldalkalibacillus uzonensis]|uniref:Lia operon protein LiaI n=1 Tax=Caldalkalibacillus uzonensis TaxID=353224 RepID=A0ABU0CW75_9BACI|nr:hypothetical protein [Caldalkalibacillus uzonensis]MDQ0340675.1 lia operon protein LiaI [Caldalkalibacillus uzonensis]
MSGKKLLGLLLLLIGASALLGMLGIHVGGLISLAIGALLIAYGAKQWKAGSRIWGGIVLGFGLLILVGSLPVVLSLLLGVALIYAGYKLITNEPDSPSHTSPSSGYKPVDETLDDPFDEEWENIMKSNP